MSIPELYELQHRLLSVADVIACAVIKHQQPAADLMTKRKAYAFASQIGHNQGRGWIDNHLLAGRLTGVRRGAHPNSPVMLSRTEIIALHEAERMQKAEITGKHQINSKTRIP